MVFCVIGIANGPEKFTVFYEKDVQDKAIKLGYTTKTNNNINYCFIFTMFCFSSINGLLYKWCKRIC